MPHRRPRSKGSFGAHFDQLVTQFPASPARAETNEERARRRAELREKIDIHAMLFERAWRLDHGSGGSSDA